MAPVLKAHVPRKAATEIMKLEKKPAKAEKKVKKEKPPIYKLKDALPTNMQAWNDTFFALGC